MQSALKRVTRQTNRAKTLLNLLLTRHCLSVIHPSSCFPRGQFVEDRKLQRLFPRASVFVCMPFKMMKSQPVCGCHCLPDQPPAVSWQPSCCSAVAGSDASALTLTLYLAVATTATQARVSKTRQSGEAGGGGGGGGCV